MTGIKCWIVGAIVFLIVLHAVSPTLAQNIRKTYDMSRFLNEPHPFSVNRVPVGLNSHEKSAKDKQSPAAPIKSATSGSRLPTITKSLAPIQPSNGWLSEIRVGLLKHAVALVGNTPKETGLDGNIEVLFDSPNWLNFLWAPRPMMGVSANSSSTNTDIVYSGLTWEWNPWSALLLDFSFGFAMHNGKLKYDSGAVFPEDAGRHREFGCRWLFRESFEGGWLFEDRHALTLMWSHYSHGGLCDDKNEGLDNVGIRYGYRF
tara:strand:+ start:572 stop:1351 length:780 start_codon:yes stop_codon:yes gene_type:complete